MPPAAEVEALRTECLRALGLVAANQLALFTTAPPPDAATLAGRVEAIVRSAGAAEAPGSREPGAPGRGDRDGAPATTAALAAALRELLRETLASFRDPYANYIDPRGHDAYARRRRGDLVGVGLKFRARGEGYPLVIGTLLGGPLDALGAGRAPRPGDLLESVDGVDLAGAGADATRARLAGAEDSPVTLGVRRGEGAPWRVEVRRRTVALRYARAERLAGGVEHVRVSRFGTDTHELVRELVERAEREGARAYVLDLRGNPGGSTRAARAVVSLFDGAAAIYCERLAGELRRRLPRVGDVLTRRPLAVLVDERSMSSAEIVAGTLQYTGRARVVGAPTWGKGLIQKVYPLAAPLGGAVRVTIATFSTPDGRPLHGRGIVPDRYVPSAPHGLFVEGGSLNLAPEALAFRRALLLEDLAARLPAGEARAFAALPDTQLRVAISLLAA